jgi:chromosome partitioning protein
VKSNLSQKNLAKICGIDMETIKKIETGKSETNINNLLKIAEGLDVDIKEIYEGEYRKTRVISVVNPFSSCGKTSTVKNLGYELSIIRDKRVLIVDADFKCGLTNSFKIENESSSCFYNALRVWDYIENRVNIEYYIKNTGYENLDIITGNYDMAIIESELALKNFKEHIGETLFEELINKGKYDYILFDCGGPLGILNFNILRITDDVIIPTPISPKIYCGTRKLRYFIEDVKELNSKLKILGFLGVEVIPEYVPDQTMEKEIKKELSYYEMNYFDTYIPYDDCIDGSYVDKKPLSIFVNEKKLHSPADKAFVSLAREIDHN